MGVVLPSFQLCHMVLELQNKQTQVGRGSSPPTSGGPLQRKYFEGRLPLTTAGGHDDYGLVFHWKGTATNISLSYALLITFQGSVHPLAYQAFLWTVCSDKSGSSEPSRSFPVFRFVFCVGLISDMGSAVPEFLLEPFWGGGGNGTRCITRPRT